MLSRPANADPRCDLFGTRFAEDIGLHSDLYAQLEYSASEPYTSFVFGSRDEAIAAHRFLLAKGLGEFSPPHGRLRLDGAAQPLGMVAFLSKQNLRKCRLVAALALRRAGFLNDASAVADRTRLAAKVLIEPHDDDLYLSRLAVVEESRGRGIGASLLEYVASEGKRLGCRRLILEVSPMHELAFQLYTRHQFVELGRPSVHDAESGRSLELIHMARNLG